MAAAQINPPNTPMLDKNGNLAVEWYRFFSALAANQNSGLTGTVAPVNSITIVNGKITAAS